MAELGRVVLVDAGDAEVWSGEVALPALRVAQVVVWSGRTFCLHRPVWGDAGTEGRIFRETEPLEV